MCVRPKILVSVANVALNGEFIRALGELGELIVVFVSELPPQLDPPAENSYHLVLSHGELKGQRRFSPCPRNWWAPRIEPPERTLIIITRQPEKLDSRQVLAWVKALLEGEENPWGLKRQKRPIRSRHPVTGWRKVYN